MAQERADMVEVFEEITNEERYQQCLRLEHFSEWVKWDNVMAQDRDWNKLIMQSDDSLFKFTLAATEDVLPTRSVLKCWNELTDAKCRLCGKYNETLRHVLCGCKTALAQ